MKKIAIIPARSGSKGLKDKNIIKVCGKPLMSYSIEAAINSKCFDKVIVTTDSEKYAEIAKKYGAEVILRGERLSNDNATSYMVIEDVIHKQSNDFDYFVLLQPTSPMRNELHIIEAIKKFENNIVDFDFLVSVIGKKEQYLQQKHFFGARSIAYIMNQIDSIDIDTELDYELACICMKKRKNI